MSSPPRATSPLIAFRADAAPAIGVGHVMRSITLASAAVASGHRCELHSFALPPVLARRAERAGVEVVEVDSPPGSVEDAERFTATVADVRCIDGYRFSPEFMEAVTGAGAPVMVIDDNREVALAGVDLVLNQNPHATRDLYADRPDLECLLGLRYALVRQEVLACIGRERRPRSAPRVVVSMGGTDVGGVTE